MVAAQRQDDHPFQGSTLDRAGSDTMGHGLRIGRRGSLASSLPRTSPTDTARANAATRPGDDGPGPASVDGEERPWGCGWFDSSHDLRQGLAVTEGDALALELAVRQLLSAASARQRA
jgi:hypothetical protein